MEGRVVVLSLSALALLGSCEEATQGREPTGLETLSLTSVEPRVVLPGTVIQIEGSSFLDQPLGVSALRLSGELEGRSATVDLPAEFIDFESMTVEVTDDTFALLGVDEGAFDGLMSVKVDYLPEATTHFSPALTGGIEFRRTLEPVLDDATRQGAIYVNSAIEVEGSGFLLGGGEGVTYAVVEGCTVPVGGDACGSPTRSEIPISPAEPFSRTQGTFPFSPHIAGISGGRFEGRLHLANVMPDGTRFESEEFPVAYDLLQTTVTALGEGGSVGQFIDIEGGGFIGAEDGITLMELSGEFFPKSSVGGVPVEGLSFIPEYVDGSLMRFVVNEQDALAQGLEDLGGIRYAEGTFDGTIRPVVSFGNENVEGAQTPIAFEIRPVKQVVWVQFTPAYVESLRKFGIRALDQRVRDRVFEVMARDYATINVELRDTEPLDFAEYTILEINGPDVNGLGLLGYDNTSGKDIDNERLSDRIGGVNAVTQEIDGYPGYGGVFIESLMAFSEHPPAGTPPSDIGNPLFDQIFDEFRPDRGSPVNSSDEAGGGIPVLTNGANCPTSDRQLQAACAVWTLGSLIGTTASHELGHALGLADPTNLTRFHNLGDGERRLMDSGGVRPFEERAELMGQGPSVFCDRAYDYLRRILPTDEPRIVIERPFC
ncbi:MAG: hypothetical protein ACE37F_15750 [Nannocystaceae bacterium]|nr:hypothetical protein [bacterium]